MVKNKHSPAPSTAAARSSGIKEMEELQTINKQLTREIFQSRKQIQRLRLELALLAPDQDDQDILAANTVSNAVQNLKSLNIRLVNQVTESRKEIKRLQSELALFVVDQDNFTGVECDVSNLILSSGLAETVTSKIVEMAEMIKKAESAAVDLEALEIRKKALLEEKENVQKNIERIIKERDSNLLSLEQRKKKIKDLELKRSGKIWKWICCVVVTLIMCIYFTNISIACPKDGHMVLRMVICFQETMCWSV